MKHNNKKLIAQAQQNIKNKALYESYIQKSLNNIHACVLEGKNKHLIYVYENKKVAKMIAKELRRRGYMAYIYTERNYYENKKYKITVKW